MKVRAYIQNAKARALVFVLILSTIGNVLLPVAPVHAQAVVYDAQAWVQRDFLFRQQEIKQTIAGSLTDASLGALMHAASYFTRKLAYDTALYVAYGGNGQGALAFQDGWGTYLEKAALDSVADGIGELGLCQVPNLQTLIFLQIGLRGLFAPPPSPNCTWQQLKNGGIFDTGAWEQKYGTREGLEETFSASLSVQNSDFGIGLGAIAQLDRNRAAAREAATAERLEGRGFKSLTSLISGDVLTPAQVVEEETKALTAKHQGELDSQQIAGIYARSSPQLLSQAASVFLNTLTATLLQRLLTEGLFTDRGVSGNSAFVSSPFADPNYNQTFQQAQNAFSFLRTRSPDRLTDFDIVPALAACPANPGINNCVIDSGMLQALSRARGGNPLTIQEALDQGFLQKNWQLISPRHEEHNNIQGCQEGKYCYSNIQKLRKLRILPIGFEVAVLRSDPDNPWTLGDVVAGFDNCARPSANDRTIVVPDAAHPFCHLINPNWVIAIPQAQCEAQVYGPQLAELGAPIRRQDCVDVSTCIAKGPDGQCLDFGYCTKEENVWRLPGTQCDGQYNTCEIFTNTQNNRVASYLGRTVDFGRCSLDNVGCFAYATEKTADVWLASSFSNLALKGTGRNQALYFDDEIRSVSNGCNAQNNGCTAFFSANRTPDGSFVVGDDGGFDQDANTLVHAKKAPDYLNCYDVRPDVLNDINTIGVQWPTTIQEATNVVARNPECANFATACVADEVGCEAFTPSDGGAVIPGSIGDENRCSAQCAGYDTFKQLGYQDVGQGFENEKFPLYFVPGVARLTMQQQGLTCNADTVGCDEFTNLDELARGGESLEYYSSIKYCERPADDGSNVQVFYSWEGSATEGFVLRTHRLRPLNQTDLRYITLVFAVGRPGENAEIPRNVYLDGGPAYADDSRASLMENAVACNKGSYELKISDPGNPAAAPEDCKSLYDTTGNAYYRLLGKSITVSGQCRALRKTEANVVIDEDITNLPAENIAMCQSRGGTWGQFPGANNNENVCVRCANGGEFKDGLCIYSAIAGSGESRVCTPQANGCRAYTGNQAGNVFDIFAGTDEDFEPGSEDPNALLAARENWNSTGVISVVSEATDVGLHSLQVDAEKVWRSIPTSTMAFDQKRLYTVSFWARGASQNIRVFLDQNDAQVGDSFVNSAGIGNVWQQYEFGPVEISNVDQDVSVDLNFQRVNGQGVYFIDHVRLTRVQDQLYLVKNSWKVAGLDAPLACDSAPFDGLPGEALGCSEYTDSNKNLHYATGFERLCREQAIGCQPVWNTYNTVDGPAPELSHVYNIFCKSAPGTECSVVYFDETISTEPCRVEVGQIGCYVKDTILPAGTDFNIFAGVAGAVGTLDFDTSTIHIPADTPAATPLYLAIGKDDLCQESARGCMLTGLETQILPDDTLQSSFEHADTYVKNDPALYGDTLCQADVAGCSEFAHNGSVSYFKDPVLTGNQLCTYRPASQLQDNFGWFLEGIGECTAGVRDGQACQTDVDCPESACVNINNIACSPNFLRSGGLYDIWSNESQNYQGFVGMCPGNQNLCTELIDRADTSNVNPDGAPYYVIYDDQVKSRLDECERVSLTEGCILLDKTDNPNKIYNTKETYTASERSNPPYAAVQPLSTAGNDANVLLKVDRDRQCSEWLACRTSVPITTQEGDIRNVCYEYAACEEIGNGGSRCGKWVDDLSTPEDTNRAFNRLTYDQYVVRPVSWYDEEFSGYSLFNSFQITDLIYRRFDFSEKVKEKVGDAALQVYLMRKLDKPLLDALESDVGQPLQRCAAGQASDWQACGPANGGRCSSGDCVFPLTGNFSTAIPIPESNEAEITQKATQLRALLAELSGNSCKAAPEQDSPFSREVGKGNELDYGNGQVRTDIREIEPRFRGANVCQEGNCECAYTKVQYASGITDYWPIGPVPSGVCQGGGIKDGSPCSTDSHCAVPARDGEVPNNGTCAKLTRKEQLIGTEGFCLQPDLSRPLGLTDHQYACLTWLPIQVSASGSDIYNANIEAGYNPVPGEDVVDSGGQVYCTAGTTAKYGPYDRTQFNANNVGNIDQYLARFVEGGVPNLSISDKVTIAENANLEIALNNGSFTEQDCDDLKNDPSEYVTAVCGGGGTLYQMVESLIWKSYQNAVILRIEQRANSNVNEEHGGNESVFGISDTGGRHPFALVPENYQRVEYGTIMHPPRIWDYNDYAQRQGGVGSIDPYRFYLNQHELRNPPPDEESVDYRTRVYGDLYGIKPPGDQFQDLATSANVYRSPYEGQLNKHDISKVFFYPLSIPAGLDNDENDLPTLLTKKLYIDFEALDEFGADAHLIDDADSIVNTEFPFKTEEGDAIVWTYKLTQDDENNSNFDLKQYAFSTYDKFHIKSNSQNFSNYLSGIKDLPRNNIAERYVMVFADWLHGDEEPPSFIEESIEKNSNNDPVAASRPQPRNGKDPFTAECNDPDGSRNGDFFAIGLDFNSDGEFLGYISRWCNANGGTGAGKSALQLAVVATLNDSCNEFTQVYESAGGNSFLEAITNKAWTNRVWAGAKRSDGSVPEHPAVNFQSIKLDSANRPYASLSVEAATLSEDTAAVQLRQYAFRDADPNYAGAPYSCSRPWLGAATIVGNRNVLQVVAPPRCAALDGGTIKLNTVETPEAAAEGLAQIFAKSYSVQRFEYVNVNNVLVGGGLMPQGTDDVSGTIGVGLKPPQIYALNPVLCRSNVQNCTAAEKNHFTVGTKNAAMPLADYDGDGIPDEDTNQDGNPDPIIAVGSYLADLRFFAFADSNRMPIRSVKVDWRDDSLITNESRRGLYKNRKPVCESSDSGGYSKNLGYCKESNGATTELTCSDNKGCPAGNTCVIGPDLRANLAFQKGIKQFGSLPRACTDSYFEFIHEYTCSKQDIEGNSAYTVPVGDLSPNIQARIRLQAGADVERVCVFTPRVQVTDNWGWCNGSCNGPGNTGCYDDQCVVDRNNDEWTYFGNDPEGETGRIIVIPDLD